MKRKLLFLVVALLALSICLVACTNEPTEPADPNEDNNVAEETEILVAAAASLKNAYDQQLIPMFQDANPGVKVTGIYDASGKLQTQIEEGLPADIFMSAAVKQMNALSDGGFINVDSRVDLLENQLVMIVPIDSEIETAEFVDVLNFQTIAIGEPTSVPAGQYAVESLTSLGVYDQMRAEKNVSEGTNVTEVLNWVAEGSADVGFVYASDAASLPDKVKIVAVAPADSLAAPVLYPVAMLSNSANAEAAQLFLDFLSSDAAIAVFESYGFKSTL